MRDECELILRVEPYGVRLVRRRDGSHRRPAQRPVRADRVDGDLHRHIVRPEKEPARAIAGDLSRVPVALRSRAAE
jgi:hypothetical protein